MHWALFSFLASIFNAMMVQLNHHYKIDGLVVAVFKNAFAFLFMLVPAFFVEWDFEPTFYLSAMILGFILVFIDITVFNAAAKYGSRLATLYMSVRILAGFVVWLILSPASLDLFLAVPWKALAVGFCLLLSCVAIFTMRAHDASWKAFLAVTPAGLLFVLVDVITKNMMEGQSLFDAAVVSATVMFATTSLFASFALFWRDKKLLVYLHKPHVRQASIPMGLAVCFLVISVNSGLALAPNPAYVNAIMLTSIMWLMLYHKFMKIPDNGNPFMGLIFVLSAVGIVLLTA